MTTVTKTVEKLKQKVAEVNELMKELETHGVEVRISYVDGSKAQEVSQGISLWRVTQHIDHL